LIDIDILLYGQQTIDAPGLQVPHPRMHLRRFVLVPLVELAPEVKHTSWTFTAAQFLGTSQDKSLVTRI
jgi:2-amino-4-hydroxy-6-hydroxymethyldihydropteridine diphosphokinase